MSDIASSTPPRAPVFAGGRLRAARRGHGLTLQALSDRAGLSVGYLSQIERDIATPSLGSLQRLASALSLDLAHFVTIPGAAGLVSRAADRETTSVRAGGMRYQRLHGDFPGASFSAFLITLPPAFETETDRHYGEEFVEVRCGRAIFDIDGDAHELGPGDTLHFRSDMRHGARNPGSEETVLFWLGSGPAFRLRPDVPGDDRPTTGGAT